jgi:UDP-N-acetyl-D-galactosamine dehydrogenase
MSSENALEQIAVIGLGYVGLPLALALAKHFSVVGYDVSSSRIKALDAFEDATNEVDADTLRTTSMDFTDRVEDIKLCDTFIVTVPTPVDADNTPNLSAVLSACKTVGSVMRPGAIVVFESTVYPGVTEDVCGPALEEASGLKCGVDFFLGYSPERINPGDKEHTIERITKVVSGQTPEVTKTLMDMYGAVTAGNVFEAKDIKTAEAAKVIENAQRDINIAFINEISMIFNKAGISTQDVLAAANTKWNFLNFRPGLVGGHCIGVDPFYLAHLSRELNHDPEIILAGRRINDGMADFITQSICAMLGEGSKNILVLGLTFKENVPDLRNSKVADLIACLQRAGHQVRIHDAFADKDEAKHEYGIDLLDDLPLDGTADCVIGAVGHENYKAFDDATLLSLMKPVGVVADLKGIWSDIQLGPSVKRWNL